MKISKVVVTPIAFKDAPVLNASGIHEPYALRSIIMVEGANGKMGLGESYGDAPVLEALTACEQRLAGLDCFDLNGLRRLVDSVIGDLPAPPPGAELAPGSQPSRLAANVYSAFEVACLDLQARTLGIPLVDLLGGAVREHVEFSAYLFFKYAEHIDRPYPPDRWGEALTPSQIVAQATKMIDEYGFKSIKLKAGALAPEEEVECIKALKQAFPQAPLRIDPNANWSLETAVRMAGLLKDHLEYYEDPTPGLEGMAALHRETGLNLATNMVVTDFKQLRDSIQLNSVQTVLSDHHYWGGLRDTQVLARMCDIFGLGISMHSNSHLGISLMAMTHVAASIPNITYACDTHYPWVNADEEVIAGGKLPIVDGQVSIDFTQPGLGVEIDYEQLQKLHHQFLSIDLRSRDDARQMRRYQPDWSGKTPRF